MLARMGRPIFFALDRMKKRERKKNCKEEEIKTYVHFKISHLRYTFDHHIIQMLRL